MTLPGQLTRELLGADLCQSEVGGPGRDESLSRVDRVSSDTGYDFTDVSLCGNCVPLPGMEKCPGCLEKGTDWENGPSDRKELI